jgi:lysozyme
MNEDRKLSPAGANLIKHFEGCLKPHEGKYRAYTCPAGVTTIGWGTTTEHGHQIKLDTVWTKQQCDEAFLRDMEAFEKSVRRLVKVPLTDYRFDALTSFCYNCGEGNLAKSSLLKHVNLQQWESAAAEFHKWNKANGKVLPGLTRRRASEALLFQNISDDNYDGKPDKVVASPFEPMPQSVDPPAEEEMS